MRKDIKKEAIRVWNSWQQMKEYLEKSLNIVTESEGVFCKDIDGKLMLNGTSTLLSSNIGHKNKYVIEKMIEQMTTLDNSTLFTSTNKPAIDYAKRLISKTNNRYEHIFYTNSGSEACDTAMKMCRQFFFNKGIIGKNKILSFKGSYHGSTIAAISLAGNEYNNRAYHPIVPGCIQVTPPDISEKPNDITIDEWVDRCIDELKYVIEKEGAETICAFITEGIQLSNGVAIIPKEYFQKLHKICKENNIIWVNDEVATGFGRTGKMFVVEHFGVWPEIITMAKGISGGYVPMGAVMVTHKIFKEFYGDMNSGKEFSNGFTSGGHPLACAAASAVMDVIEKDNLIKNSSQLGEYLLDNLKDLNEFPIVNTVQGNGLMIGVKLKDVSIPLMPEWGVAYIVCQFLMKAGVMLYPDGPNNIIIAPPLTSTKDDCDKIINGLNKVIRLVNKLVEGSK